VLLACRALLDGDIVNIDVTVYLNGYHGDTSRTFFVGQRRPAAERLVAATEEALQEAIKVGEGGERLHRGPEPARGRPVQRLHLTPHCPAMIAFILLYYPAHSKAALHAFYQLTRPDHHRVLSSLPHVSLPTYPPPLPRCVVLVSR